MSWLAERCRNDTSCTMWLGSSPSPVKIESATVMRDPATLTLLVELVFFIVMPRMVIFDPERTSISHRCEASSSAKLAAGLRTTLECIVISEIRHPVQSVANDTDVHGDVPLFTCSVALAFRCATAGS